jgi:antitoxin MazE
MTVRQRIVRIGNSRGVRLPSQLLSEAHLVEGDEVELSVEPGQIVMRPARRARQGWAERFAEMTRHGDDRLLDGDQLTASSFDDEEWEW